MAERETVRLQPEAMHIASQALSSAAKDLQNRLNELDGQICDVLAGWHGGAGGAYGEAWNSWHRGAAEVQQGLSMLASTVGVVGAQFQTHDQTSAQTVDGVYHG